VLAYLNSTGQHERTDALDKLATLEGGTPSYVAQLIAHLKPDPGQLGEPVDGIPGLYEISVPGLPGRWSA